MLPIAAWRILKGGRAQLARRPAVVLGNTRRLPDCEGLLPLHVAVRVVVREDNGLQAIRRTALEDAPSWAKHLMSQMAACRHGAPHAEWGDSPKVASICEVVGEIGGLNVGEASLCLGVAIEELMYGSWSGGTRRYRVAEVGKVVPLYRSVLTSDIDGGESRRPHEGEKIAGIGVEIRVDDVERGELVSRPDPDRTVAR